MHVTAHTTILLFAFLDTDLHDVHIYDMTRRTSRLMTYT